MKIGIIGAGNLGSAVARLVKRNLKPGDSICLADKKRVNFSEFERKDNITTIENSDLIFLCVKPCDISNVINEINNSKQNLLFSSYAYNDNKLIVSCAAGVSIDYIEENLKFKYPVIRTMMNLPIIMGEGTITYTDNQRVDSDLLENFYSFLKGPEIYQIEESLLDLSTILIGCMPAFQCYLSEEIINFGVKNGLSYETSRDLYTSTVRGTMKLLDYNTCQEIIDAVSSPDGVTVQGISYLNSTNIKSILRNTLENSLKKKD